MDIIRSFDLVISAVFLICYSYQIFYVFIYLISLAGPRLSRAGLRSAENADRSRKKRGGHTGRKNRYRVLICARNEEKVIAQLIESIKRQTYPEDHVDVFVMADNCTDSTRAEAVRRGAKVYERQNRTQVGKGYALNALLRSIRDDHGTDLYDGYFVFDADNILSEDYIEKMDMKFTESGKDVLTSFRNSKNYSDSWVSAGNALWFMKDSAFLNRPRDMLGVDCVVSGTGFMFSKDVLRKTGGWPFHLLSEDLEFTAWCVENDISVGYCHDRQFFDEQTSGFSQSCTQRMRWTKGYYRVTVRHFGALVKKVSDKGDFSSLDLLLSVAPGVVLTFVSRLFWTATTLFTAAGGKGMAMLGHEMIGSFLGAYLTFFAIGALTTAANWKRIYAPAAKKILYLFTFPLFMATYIPISMAALFTDVRWSPIAHSKRTTLDDIRRGR